MKLGVCSAQLGRMSPESVRSSGQTIGMGKPTRSEVAPYLPKSSFQQLRLTTEIQTSKRGASSDTFRKRHNVFSSVMSACRTSEVYFAVHLKNPPCISQAPQLQSHALATSTLHEKNCDDLSSRGCFGSRVNVVSE